LLKVVSVLIVEGNNELQKNEQKKLFLLVGRKCEEVYVQHGRSALIRRGLCSGQGLQKKKMAARLHTHTSVQTCIGQ